MSIVIESPAPVQSQPAYRRLKQFVIAATGLAYYGERDDELGERIKARLAELQMSECGDYLELLERDKAGEIELDKLTEQLTIGETYFFRHQEAFDALRQTVLPNLIQRNREQRRLRIWSAGCSTGAEAYSLAILLKRDLAHLVAGWDITILGTDINREYLAAARRGRFERWAMRSTSEELRAACFDREEESWRIKPQFQEGVSFDFHNLAKHPIPSRVNNLFAFDLIVCRNVMIYFSPDIVRRFIDQCQTCLVDGGWLLVGHAETNTESYRAFRTVRAAGAVLYQKADPPRTAPLGLGSSGAMPPSRVVSPPCPTGVKSFARRQRAAALRRLAVIPPERASRIPTIAEIRRLADEGELAAASRGCQQLMAVDRLNPAVHFYQALLFEQLERHPEAEAALKSAIDLDRDYWVAHYYLGAVLQRHGERRRAEQAFRGLMKMLAPQSPEQLVPDADDLTIADLNELIRVHLEELQSP